MFQWFRKRSRRRTIFIGDVHGCSAELRRLVDRLDPGPEDRVILLGDLVNRGPDSAGVVRYVAGRGFESLMGNHDRDYLENWKKKDSYRRLRADLGRDLHRWLARRPLYIEDDRFIAVHAGLMPERHPSRTPPHILLNIRTWDGRGADLAHPDNPPWYDFYSGDRPVFYGHWARKGLNLRANTIGLDSGVVYGRALSAYILESKELIQEAADRVYYTPPSLRNLNAAGGAA